MSWIEDAYDVLAPEILDRGEGMARDDAERFLIDCEDVDLISIDAKHAIDQLLDRGYLYDVEETLFVTAIDK